MGMVKLMICGRRRTGSAEGSSGSQETSMTCTTARPPARSRLTSAWEDATLASIASASLTFPFVIVCNKSPQPQQNVLLSLTFPFVIVCNRIFQPQHNILLSLTFPFVIVCNRISQPQHNILLERQLSLAPHRDRLQQTPNLNRMFCSRDSFR